MKKLILAATVAAASLAPAANAAVIVTAVAATPVYSGPTPTYTFDAAVPLTGGQYATATSGTITKPTGATGNFLVVMPNGTNTFPGLNPATINLSSFGNVADITFLWGSRDVHNTVQLLNSAGSVLFAFTGAQLAAFTPGPSLSYLVHLRINDAPTQTAVAGGGLAGLNFITRFSPFEVDNVTIRAVPETSTWMMMLLGFGALGFAMRQRKVSVRYA
jgi:opacity protein-like surface antigen